MTPGIQKLLLPKSRKRAIINLCAQRAYDSSQLNPVAWFSSVQLDKHAIFIVLAQIKQVSGVGGLASLAIKDYILQF